MSELVTIASRPAAQFSFGPGTSVARTALRISEGIDFAAWEEIGRRLLELNEASKFWIGDWLAYGEWSGHWGETYRQAVAELDLKYDATRSYAYVASHVPEAVRRDDLYWSHHRVVAKLKPTDQEHWLKLAAEATPKWSVRRLDEEITAALASAAPTPEPTTDFGRSATRVAEFEQLILRAPASEVSDWRAKARRAGITLDAWARKTLNAAEA